MPSGHPTTCSRRSEDTHQGDDELVSTRAGIGEVLLLVVELEVLELDLLIDAHAEDTPAAHTTQVTGINNRDGPKSTKPVASQVSSSLACEKYLHHRPSLVCMQHGLHMRTIRDHAFALLVTRSHDDAFSDFIPDLTFDLQASLVPGVLVGGGSAPSLPFSEKL